MNQTKFYYWKSDLYSNCREIHDELNQIFNNLTNLRLICDLYRNVACPYIQYDKKEIKKLVHEIILTRKLKFKYDKTEKWGLYERQQLLIYIDCQDEDWYLNTKNLEELYKFFHGKFSIRQLKIACYFYGFSFSAN